MGKHVITFIITAGLLFSSSLHATIRYGQVDKYHVGNVPYITDFAEHNGDYEKRPLHFGDFNNDDIVDLFIINDKESSKFTILYGTGDGGFEYDTTLNFDQKAYDYLILDFDRDGFDDVLVAIDDFVYFAFLNDGSGNWTSSGSLSDPYLKYINGVCDCNGDGFDDFIGHSEYDDEAMGIHFIIGINDTLSWPENYIFHDSGSGTFWYPVGDFNGDGWTDFLASYGWSADALLVYFGADSCIFNFGQVAFDDLGFCTKLNIGNFNNDAYDDIVYSVCHSIHHNSIDVVLGDNGGLKFNEALGYPWRTEHNGCWYSNYIVVGDVNGDGNDDIGVVERDFDEVNGLLPVYLHYSDGDFFSPVCDTLIVPSERYAHMWSNDFNGDGVDDLCYFSSTETLAVYLSEGPNATFLRSFHAWFERSRGVVIDWEVVGTEDCEKFMISRAVGDEPYMGIAEVPSVPGKLAYSYSDGQVQSVPGGKVGYRLDVYERDGSTRVLALKEVVVPGAVLRFHQNYPNPFNPGTRIVFELPAGERVWLSIYDVSGRLVRRLVSGKELGPGTMEEFWDGKNEQGLQVSSGVYYCTLRAGKEMMSRKMLLLK